MESAVIFLNRVFDLIWIPLSHTPPYIDIVFISLVSGVAFLLVFKKTSNQEMIEFYKNRIIGHLLEMRLYKDDPILTFKTIFKILGYNFIYLRFTLVPIVFIALPVTLICVQLNNRYGYLPMEPDVPFIIRAQLDSKDAYPLEKALMQVRIQVPKGVVIDTAPIRILSDALVLWRLRIINPQPPVYDVKIGIGEQKRGLSKEILCLPDNNGISPGKTKWHWKNLLVDNVEGFIPETSPFEAITVAYRHATYPFLLWHIDPVVLYFIWTLIFGFIFKPIIKVRI